MPKPLRILLLEDSPYDVQLIVSELRLTFPKAEFRAVDNEKDFTTALASFKPDVVLSDYTLPQFDGMKALRLTKEILPDAPFILVTGSMNEETAVACMKEGAADYIIKEHLRRIGPAVFHCLEERKLRSRQRSADEALKRSERHYRLLFETAPVGILSAKPNGSITSVNPEALRILGSPSAEATMSINLLTFPPLNQFGLSDEFRRVLKSKEPISGERPYTTKWGKSIDLYYQVAPIFDDRNRIESLLIIIQDVTERRRSEKELRSYSERLVKLLGFINELQHEPTIDGLYRRAVEFILGELGIDRAAFWYFNKSLTGAYGTYGTDENGRLRDERTAFIDFIPKDVQTLLKSREPSLVFREADLSNDKGEVVGRGHHVVASMTDGEKVIGFLSADNLLRGLPMSEYDRDLLGLLATSIGHLITMKRLEGKLQESARHWQRTFDAIRNGVCLLDGENHILQYNEAFRKYFQGGDDPAGKLCYRYIHGTDQPVPNCPFDLAKRSLRRERMEMVINGSVFEVTVDPITDEQGRLTGAVHIITDITERKRAEEERERLLALSEQSRRALLNVIEDQKATEAALRQSEEKYRGIFENIQDVYFEADLQGNLLEISPSIAVLSKNQYRREELIGRPLFEFAEADALQLFSEMIRREGRVADWEIHLRNKDGTLVPCAVTAGIRLDSVTGEKKIVGSLRDITERKRDEEQMRRDLEIKRRLLQELYHRTKNNMQVIISMLRVNAARLQDPSIEHVKEMISGIELKIHAMALVHQKLYQSQDLSHVNLREYFHDLIDLLKRSNPAFLAVKVTQDMQDVQVMMDTAMPLGMVVSELITNMIKHAFPDGRKGEMFLGLQKDADGRLILEFADNGVGLPPGFDYRRDAGIGLDTVIGQVEHQLDGEITFENRNGLYCRIVLKRELYWERV